MAKNKKGEDYIHPRAKPLTKEQIKHAIELTRSIPAAARYLNCSYHHIRQYMKMYSSDTHENMLKEYANRGGAGNRRYVNLKKDPLLIDIIEGRANPVKFKPGHIKYRLIQEGYLKEECCRCEFKERRVNDFKMPLVLFFRDKNKYNYKLDNLELLCYNCYFLYCGEVFNDNDILQLESTVSLHNTTDFSDLELDDYTKEQIEKLGYEKKKPEQDDYDILAYKYGKPKT